MDLLQYLTDQGVVANGHGITLMRHASGDYPDLFKYVGMPQLTLYQALQDHAYEPGHVLVGFFGHRAKHAILLGVWRVKERIPSSEALKAGLLDGSFELVRENHWKRVLGSRTHGLNHN